MGLFKRNTIPEEVKLDEIDRESKYKLFSPLGDKIIMVVLTAWAIFQLYASISNKVPLQILRYTHLGLAISMAYILYPATIHSDRHKLPWYDCVLAALFVCVVGYFIINYRPLQFRAGSYTRMDTVMAGLGIALVLLACWRVVGPPIVIIASCFLSSVNSRISIRRKSTPDTFSLARLSISSERSIPVISKPSS